MLRRGWTITACDISAAMVEKAREKFPEGVTFDVCDMRELPVYGSFELVWALNDPVNYLLGDDDLVAGAAGDDGEPRRRRPARLRLQHPPPLRRASSGRRAR